MTQLTYPSTGDNGPHVNRVRIKWGENIVKDLAHCLTPQQNPILIIIVISSLGAGPCNPPPQRFPVGEQTAPQAPPPHFTLLSPSSPGPFPPRLPRPAPPRPSSFLGGNFPPADPSARVRPALLRPGSRAGRTGRRATGTGRGGSGRARVSAAAGRAGAGQQGSGALTVSEPGPPGRGIPTGRAGWEREAASLPGARPGSGKAPASPSSIALPGRRKRASLGDPTRGRSLLRLTLRSLRLSGRPRPGEGHPQPGPKCARKLGIRSLQGGTWLGLSFQGAELPRGRSESAGLALERAKDLTLLTSQADRGAAPPEKHGCPPKGHGVAQQQPGGLRAHPR